MAAIEDINQTLDRQLKELCGEAIKYGSFSAENFGVTLISNKETNGGEARATRYFELNNFTKEDGEWCMQNLERSYFSHKNEKTYDDNVRISVSTKFFYMLNWNILERYLHELLGISMGYLIEPYKFNCYGVGSFFDKHVDTPSTAMLGTLIIIPNSRFSGGELVFSDFFHPNKFDLAKAIIENLNNKVVQCVYFDKFKEHQVAKVTEGFRCSLVFKVLERKVPSKNSSDPAKISGIDYIASTVDQDFCKRAANKCYEVYKDKTNILVSTEAYPKKFMKELKSTFKNYKKVYHLGDETVPDRVYGRFSPPNPDTHGDDCGSDYPDEDLLEDHAESPYKVNFVLGSDENLFGSESYELWRTHGYTGNSPDYDSIERSIKVGLLLNPGETEADSDDDW